MINMTIQKSLLNTVAAGLMSCGVGVTVAQADDPIKRNAYFGQTHQHTGWSFDANIYNVQLGPENAFKHAPVLRSFHIRALGRHGISNVYFTTPS